MNNKKESICVNCKNCMVTISTKIYVNTPTLMRITREEETHNCLVINKELEGVITSCSKFILDDKNN